jgi:putative transposase
MMTLIEQRGDGVSVVRACRALGVSRATLYRRRKPRRVPPAGKPGGGKRRPPRRLSPEERTKLIKTLHAPEFADQPPAEIFGALLSKGIYLASVRTMYRVLSELGESHDRRRQRTSRSYAPPRLTATAPNQVWTWDISKLPSTVKGVFFYLYLVMDLFSRYVVGWMVSPKENAAHATRLIGDTVARWGIEPGTLQLHSDRGSPMKSGSMAQMTAMLGVALSFSRPRISDDNPFVESQFKTFKTQPDYPEAFGSLLHARGWSEEFFAWHNDDHHHENLALFTPADVFNGRVAEVAARRQAALDAAFAAHPERFVRGRPSVKLPPAAVSINPLAPESLPTPPRPPLIGNSSDERAEDESRAAPPAREAREPLTRPSTLVSSTSRRAGPATSS